MPASTAFIEGLKALSQERGISVREAAMVGILDEWLEKKIPDMEDITDIIDAYRVLEAPELYVMGILGGAGLGPNSRKAALWESASDMMLDLQNNKAREHLKPLLDAYLYLTGERFSRTP